MSTRKEQAQATAVALKQAALELFAEQGYRDTKITDITRRAGRAAGSFYNHFTDKDDLLARLLTDLFDEGDQELLDIPGHDPDFGKRSAIRYHVEGYWRFRHKAGGLLHALSEASATNPEFARTLRGLISAQLQDLLGHLQYVRAPLPGPPEAVLAALFDMLGAFHDSWRDSQQFHGTLDENAAIELATTLVDRALNAER